MYRHFLILEETAICVCTLPTVIDETPSTGRSARTATSPNGAAPTGKVADYISALAKILEIDAGTMKTGGDRTSSRKRAYAAYALKTIKMPAKDIAAGFDRDNPWVYSIGARFDDGDRAEMARIMPLFRQAMDGASDESAPAPRAATTPKGLSLAPRPSSGVELHEEAIPAGETLEQISAKVFVALVPPNILLAPDPTVVLMMAKQAMVFIASGSLSASEIVQASGIPEDAVYQMVGQMVFKIRSDPGLAKRIRTIQRS